MDGFDVVPTVPVVLGEDLEACAAPIRAYTALYIGGMGSRQQNFYNALAGRMGHEAAAAEIQELYLAKDYAAAAAAVPQELIDQTSLIGPVDRISERLVAYAEAGVTTLSVATYHGSLDERVATLRSLVEAMERGRTGLVISWFEAVVFGLVQGLTEFLPISSSGHLLVVERRLRVGGPRRRFHGRHPARHGRCGGHLLPARHRSDPQRLDALAVQARAAR